jgi:RNA recognition motif-containing protein
VTKTLYFGNLSWNTTEDDLSRLVSGLAEVISARVVTERDTGRSRGFGFVEVPEEAAQAVIDALNGTELDGRQIVVNESEARTPRAGGGRGRQRY